MVIRPWEQAVGRLGTAMLAVGLLPLWASGANPHVAERTGQNQARVQAAIDFLADVFKPSCDPRDLGGSRERMKAGVKRYVELNFDPPHEALTKTMTDALAEKLGIGEVKPELLQLRDPVIREALLGSLGENGGAAITLPALKEKARAICLSIVRLKVPEANLASSELAFADDLAEEVARSHPAPNRSACIRLSAYQVTREGGFPVSPGTVITEDAAKELRGWLETADQVLLTTPVNDRALGPQERKNQLLKILESDGFQQIFATAVKIPGAKPGPADLSVLTKIVESVIAKKPAPPATEPVPTAVPIPTPPAPQPPGSPAPTTTPPASLLTADAEKALRSFLKEAHDELLNIEVNEKKLTRDERKQQLLKYLDDDDGFLAEFREAVGKPNATISPDDRKALEKIIDGLLDEPATKKPSGGGPTGGSKGKTGSSGKKGAGQAITVVDDVASIMGFPTITQFSTLATDVYTLLGSSNLSGSSLFGRQCRLFPGRRSVRYVWVAPW